MQLYFCFGYFLEVFFVKKTFNKLSQRHGNTTPSCIYSLPKPCIISLQPTAQPPPERPPRRRAVHPRRESDPILASKKTRKISEKFQQDHSILAHMNCKEFPMKFPRSLKFPTTLTLITYPSTVVKWWVFSGGQGGHLERLSIGSTFSWPWKRFPSLHHHEGRSPS